MATILPTNLLEFVLPIIVFIFIFTIFFALLSKIKFFSENKPLNSLIAFCVAILFIIIPEARQVIEIMTPWFVVFVVAGLLLIMAFMILGVEPKFIKEVAEESGLVWGVVVGGVVFLFLLSLSKVFGPTFLEVPGPQEMTIFSIVKRTLLTPKLLGFVILLIIAAEVVRRVGYRYPSK